MATLLLSAAGAALGGTVGGSILGVSAAALGRAAGATLGRVIDQKLLGTGSSAVETGKIDKFRLTGAGEGAPIGQLYGRMRLGGQVIWATQFLERATTTGGGKGQPAQPKTTEYSYSISVAVALCEGEISRVGRVWADGEEIAPGDLNMRVYPGTMDQEADPKIAATQGIENAPAYRGTAYVVFEDLELEPFGNRVPQFSFEVVRSAQDVDMTAPEDLPSAVQAVAMMPGTGEYTLATTAVYYDAGFGDTTASNVNTAAAKSDFEVSLETLTSELPQCQSTSLIVSWFGDDLRCGQCSLKPLVERTTADAANMPWRVSGIARQSAEVVPFDGDRPLYGGTPSDASVVEAIAALREAGQAVMFYPFVLMTQKEGNTLVDPYTGAAGQPKLPWRGRITLEAAPGTAGTSDKTAAAISEVEAFLGQAAVGDFAVSGTEVEYRGPADAGFRRFILHYAHLCAAAGGVDAFCIGSELRGLTQIRGDANRFPFVEGLIQLASDVRSILGPDTKISYAADWSEYFGYQPADGSQDLFFHLDPLWASDDIDFIGIDNYMPLSDWRDGDDHLDAAAGTVYDLDYLKSNIEGGEGFDWYYHSTEAREAQIRTPIEDGAYGEPWVFRYKDLRNWWGEYHHNRIGGVRAQFPTEWEPQSKPFWFTEYGCAAIDKATNEPNKFLDTKSSESSEPVFSNGQRDPLIQLQYVRAMTGYWAQGDTNPTSVEYGGPMVDMTRAHLWAWDARPYPYFPALTDLWSDGENYVRGHWVTGRSSARPLASVVAEICARSGLDSVDVSDLHGFVRGYHVPDVSDARAALQPLMLAYGFDAIERDGVLRFSNRSLAPRADVAADTLVQGDDAPVLNLERAAEPEVAGRVQVGFIDVDGDFEAATSQAIFPDERTVTLEQTELNLALTRNEARQIAERWLAEARVARDVAQFTLPPSQMNVGVGDIVEIAEEGGVAQFRIDRAEETTARSVEATRMEPAIYDRPRDFETYPTVATFVPPLPVYPVFLDLPLITGDEAPHAPHLAVTASDWPGTAAVFRSATESDFSLLTTISTPASLGQTITDLPAGPCALWDRGNSVRVKLTRGTLASATEEAVLAGANLAAIGDGSTGNWELIQFTTVQLLDGGVYELSGFLRGQAGSDGLMPAVWPEGSTFVVLDSSVPQLALRSGTRNLAQYFRIGPAGRPFDDPSYAARTESFAGIGLRPYAPAHLSLSLVAGAAEFSWVRRTRIDGDIWDVPDVPLGETDERYVVRVFDGSTLLRETIVTEPTWTYGAADIASDGAPAIVTLEVGQISEKFGSGLVQRRQFSIAP